jgi:hypothetical protein
MRRYLIVLFLTLALLPTAIISAEGEQATISDVGTYTADARTARIAALKSTYKIKLDDKEKLLVSSRCIGAQVGLHNIAKKLSVIKTEREITYSKTILTLIQLKSTLQEKHIDTSSIDLLIVSYQQSKSMFDSAVLAYDLTLEDATSLNCVSAPEDFRAALEGVRAARKPVVDASAQIKVITRSNLKTTFDSIRLKLQTETSGSGE